MGRYTIKGSRAFDERVDRDLAVIEKSIKQSIVGNLLGAVLLGGYGRGEGTPFHHDEIESPFNDYDIVVVSGSSTWRQCRNMRRQLSELEQRLTQRIGLPVDIYLHTV